MSTGWTSIREVSRVVPLRQVGGEFGCAALLFMFTLLVVDCALLAHPQAELYDHVGDAARSEIRLDLGAVHHRQLLTVPDAGERRGILGARRAIAPPLIRE